MDVRSAYDKWSSQYDSNANRTRDLEGLALREMLAGRALGRVLEIGCGTGKNTTWLASQADHVTAIDLSAGMLELARRKVTVPHVTFRQADILQPWSFTTGLYDLVTFSLVLEHIQDLDAIMLKVKAALAPGGQVYIGELHPFKQYTGTKARFETPEGTRSPTCYPHHISDFMHAARHAGLHVEDILEYFDDDRKTPPRLLVLRLEL